MELATREERLDLGRLQMRVRQVQRLEDLVDAQALLRDEHPPEPPYWAHLWTGSRVLAGLVANDIECRGRRAIDLGCGLGVAGVAAALRGARTVLVDHVLEAVRFAQENARLNACPADAAVIDLLRPGLRGRFDLGLAADVTYDPALQQALADFVRDHLAPGGALWCVESVRTTDRGFFEACRARGLAIETRELPTQEEGRRLIVRLMIVRSPAPSCAERVENPL